MGKIKCTLTSWSISPHEALNDDEEHESNLAQILEANYQKIEVRQVADNQKHLTNKQGDQLPGLLSTYTKLFSGKLGLYPHRKLHLELAENAQPVHRRAYPVPHSNLEVFRNEPYHLVELGVLSKCGASEWAAPTSSSKRST